MLSGLLWFDNDPARGLTAKITDAAQRYREKFGVIPNTCYVNRAALDGTELIIPLQPGEGTVLHVLPAANILPHHFWVGVEEERNGEAEIRSTVRLTERPAPRDRSIVPS